MTEDRASVVEDYASVVEDNTSVVEDNASVVEDNTSPQADKEVNKVKTAAERLGFYADGVQGQLYTRWRKQIHRGILNFNSYGPEESGTNRWENICQWPAGQPTMGPAGQRAYNDEAIQRSVRMLCDDVAKKARNSGQAMCAAIHQACAAYRDAHDGHRTFIGPPKWLLPDVE